MSLPTYEELFTGFRTSAFRIEALNQYLVGEEEDGFREYARGIPSPSPEYEIGLREWTNTIKEAVASGKSFSRVHVISDPLTPYLKCEIDWGYTRTHAAGEEIYILHDSSAREFISDKPLFDFWLFDESIVALMNYDDEGHFLGATVTSDRDVVLECLRQRDVAMSVAESLPEYLRRVRGNARDLREIAQCDPQSILQKL